MPEAKMRIGRYRLNSAQSMTVRVALEVFGMSQENEKEDITAAAYKRRVTEVVEMIQSTIVEKKHAKP